MLGQGTGFCRYPAISIQISSRVESLKPLGRRDAQTTPPSQIRKAGRRAIEQFGFVLPVVIDVDSRVIAGWGLAVAAKKARPD